MRKIKYYKYYKMDFDNQNSSQTGNSNNNFGQSLLGSLVQTVGDDVLNVGSRYLEQKLDQWAQNL